ncbi:MULTISPECIES: UDP-3-O-(3-hydroxymyristoyl)glucosamine N-acyltransferase [unclassified Lentimonas]|uniref:UDP-3-O-(3-hydroxymyristoyl)glucosamine N-acyltransferase n=1 Tax=unclassified Lentimonas TaxID=2630993 RepID=UPI00132131E2|nr:MULTISPECIES: UDP-3-O-(3-hydroxymyristoyl)glucosamine N-acyltransferase [unclassified Lentimonas]CAA6691789.1 UDP-3-O-[3-hydroxymyristoyl] glucosamine N-acyltransferase (EC [Lentimonas sp. CC19]CAA6694538.1 UDP-3-O-[3-hydroxymyristoyl] glucosamine N-acyltransferase (EC [Lentimonas sp. CC10]CAA7072080.1 UDP-3-O-[3-hydroxymyristoyl] glucosamine N-acyltransferase (EC [Lentimonas sp. CC11]
MTLTAAALAKHLNGEVIGDGSLEISGFATADRAVPGDLTFAEKDSYFAAADASNASAVLVAGDCTSTSKVLIQVANPRIAAAYALQLLYPPETFSAGIDASATVADSATIDPSAHIGPGCVIGENVSIGAGTVLLGGNHVAHDSQLGSDVRLHPNVVLYSHTVIGDRTTIHASTVIGADGYGYVFDQGRHVKMPQIGNVVIGNDVEIGSNTSIDRAALGSTTIGSGTKIDNLVHIAHNVTFGDNCLILGQTGFAGSTTFGDYCVIASQSGVAGHLNIGNQVTIGSKSGVMRDIADKETVLGFPAVKHTQAKRQWVGVQRLPDIQLQLRELQKQVAALQARLD